MQYKNSSWTGETLEITFEMENKTNQDLVFRLIDIPQLNGWSCYSFARISSRNISANKTEKFEISGDTYGISNKSKENLKEFAFNFTISTQGNYMQKIEEETLYTVKDCKIKTSYYDGIIESPIDQNKNIGTSLYADENLDIRANLKRNENGGDLEFIMLNDGYTSSTPVSNREELPTDIDNSDVISGIQNANTGSIDYTYMIIKKIKINGIEINNGIRSGINMEFLQTIGNSAAIENVNINLKSEELSKYNIDKIDKIELIGEVYKVEKYYNKGVVVTKIGQFEDAVVQ